MRYLIVSADDFGLTKSVNEGIAMAAKEGIVTSLSLMPAGEAFAGALGLLKDLNIEKVGVHLALTETKPTLEPAKVTTLVAKDGKFYKNHNDLFFKLFLRKIGQNQIYDELKNQVEMVLKSGLKITNLSSHEHIHMIPAILDIFVRLAIEYDIPAMRYPRGDRPVRGIEPGAYYRSLVLAYFSKDMYKALRGAGISYTGHFLGLLDSGKLTEDLLIDIFSNLKEGTTELVSHPGFLGPEILDRYRFHINCEKELSALTSRRVKKFLDENGIKLVGWEAMERSLTSEGS